MRIFVDNVYKNFYLDDQPSYYKVVEFSPRSQGQLIPIDCLGISLNQPHPLRQKVTVYYSPSNRLSAEVLPNYWWFPGVFILLLGCVFLLFTFCLDL